MRRVAAVAALARLAAAGAGDAGAQGACVLRADRVVAAAADAARVAAPRGNTTAGVPSGPYKVGTGTIKKVPGLTKGGTSSAGIWYPTNGKAGEKFPLISFAHGTGVGGSFPATPVSYKSVIDSIVSYGFIVVAPNTCPTLECASTFAVDQLATITACKNDPGLHPAIANVDFDTVGVAGHSMGAMATMASAGGGRNPSVDPAQYHIKAAVSMHPCQDAYEHAAGIKVPIMFTAGSTDTICADGCSKTFYGNVPKSVPKILLDIKGASHFEPTNTGDNCEDGAIAHFFACWLRGDQCDKVYGSSGKAVCTDLSAGHSTSTCSVSGGGPGPSPPPPPPAPTPPSPSLYTCHQNQCVAAQSGLSKAKCESACGGP